MHTLSSRKGGQMGETQEFFQMLLEGVVLLLQAEQVDGGKVIHNNIYIKKKQAKTGNKNWVNTPGTFFLWSGLLSLYCDDKQTER